MELFTAFALLVVVPVAGGLLVRALAGDADTAGVSTLLAPVASVDPRYTPVVREPEAAPWRFDGLRVGGAA